MYALKKIKLLSLTEKEKEKENALNEVRILASIDHKALYFLNSSVFNLNLGEQEK